MIFNPKNGTDFKFSSKYCESVYKTYDETIGEIEKLGDMKWLFEAVMGFQSENIGMDPVKCDFSFRLTDQGDYESSFK